MHTALRLVCRRSGTASLKIASTTRRIRPPLFVQRDGQRRNLAGIPPILLPPVVFGGLVVTLWTWKCLMMVVFQNKIIYMPGLPPNARRERIEDYKNQCSGIEWTEKRTRARDGIDISLCIGSVETGPSPLKIIYILYFQGNASSLPPRLPFLSPVLRILSSSNSSPSAPVRYRMVCCSYRGYWTSKGRPSEKGINQDTAAALQWIKDDSLALKSQFNSHESQVVLWGQSIGAGFAANLASASSHNTNDPPIAALILETPFLSIKSMLETLYPQKWLPYRYLWPFLRNHLDTYKVLGNVAEVRRKTTQVLILDAGKDELVPKNHGDELEKRCKELGFIVRRRTVAGALHTEAIVRTEGRAAVVDAIRRVEGSDHKTKIQALESGPEDDIEDYKDLTVGDFLKECTRLDVDARSFVFLASRLRQKEFREYCAVRGLKLPYADYSDYDPEEELEGLQLSSRNDLLNLETERKKHDAAAKINPDSYPCVSPFETWDLAALTRAYKNHNLGDLPGEVFISQPLLAKSLITYEFSAIEKKFKEHFSKPAVGESDSVEFNNNIVMKHFELEEKCLRSVVKLEKQVMEDRVKDLEWILETLDARREGWLKRAHFGEDLDQLGPTFGVLERTFMLS